MAVPKPLKQKIQSEINDLLVKYGRDHDFGPVYKKYANEVAKSTFYWWVKSINDSGIPAQKAIRTAKKRAKRKAVRKKAVTKKALKKVVVAEVIEVLPALPDSTDTVGCSLIEMGQKLNTCMEEMEALMKHSKNDKGGIRNTRLLLQATEGLRRTIDSAAKLRESIWDVRRAELFMTALLNRLRHRDPEFIELVLGDIKQVNKDWGISV